MSTDTTINIVKAASFSKNPNRNLNLDLSRNLPYTMASSAMTSYNLTKTFAGQQLDSKNVRLPTSTNRKQTVVVKALFKKKTPAPAVPVTPPYQNFKVALPFTSSGKAGDLREFDVTLGFTKANELFVGHTAMLGFAAAVFGEILTGKGALAQIGLETGLPISEIEPLILIIASLNVFAAFSGYLGFSSGKFIPETKEEEKTQAFSFRKATLAPVEGKGFKEFFGITDFGFTKENELFVGRVAQLGFAAALIGEGLTGLGPLAQFGVETGLPLNETEPLLLIAIMFLSFTAVYEGTGKFDEESK